MIVRSRAGGARRAVDVGNPGSVGHLALAALYSAPCSKMSTGSGSASAVRSIRGRPRPWPGRAPGCPGCARTSPRGCASAARRAAGRLRWSSGSRAGRELPARHVPQGGGVVHDLVEREQAEVHRHDLDDRPHAPIAAPMPAPTNADSDSGVSRMRSGPNSSSSPSAHREAAAVGADVLAHEEHPLVGRASPRASRRAHRWCGPGPGRARRSCGLVVRPASSLGCVRHVTAEVLDPRAARRRRTRRRRRSRGDLGLHLGEVRVVVELAVARAGRRVLDRVALAPLRDLGLVAVALGVVHRVRPEPVGAQLEEVRPAAAADVRRAPAGPRRPRARPCRRPTRPACSYAGALSARSVCGLRTGERGAHRVQVVLAAEQHRQVPQRGEVHATRGTRPRPSRPHRRSRRSPGRGLQAVGEGQPDGDRAGRRRRSRCRRRTVRRRRTGASTRPDRRSSRRPCRTSRPSPAPHRHPFSRACPCSRYVATTASSVRAGHHPVATASSPT
jgi:hypothetical protein